MTSRLRCGCQSNAWRRAAQWAWRVFPRRTSRDGVDGTVRHLVGNHQSPTAHTASSKKSDHLHSLFVQMTSMITRAARASAPALGHLTHVLVMRAKPQMIWPHARAIVADVQNVQARWNRPEVRGVRQFVRPCRVTTAADTKAPVAITGTRTFPHPATGCFLNLRPEAVIEDRLVVRRELQLQSHLHILLH